MIDDNLVMKSTSVSNESQWYGCDNDIMKLLGIQPAVNDRSQMPSNDILMATGLPGLSHLPEMSLKSTETLSQADFSLTSRTVLNEQVNNIVSSCNEPEFDVIDFLRAESIPGLDTTSESGSRFKQWFQATSDTVPETCPTLDNIDCLNESISSLKILEPVEDMSSVSAYEKTFQNMVPSPPGIPVQLSASSRSGSVSGSFIRQSDDRESTSSQEFSGDWRTSGSSGSFSRSMNSEQLWEVQSVRSSSPMNNEQQFICSPYSTVQRPHVSDDQAMLSSSSPVSNVQQDFNWQLFEQPGNVFYNVKSASSLDLQSSSIPGPTLSRSSSPHCPRILPGFSFNSPHPLAAQQSHSMRQLPVSPSYVMPPSCNTRSASFSAAGQLSYPKIHLSSQLPVQLAIPPPQLSLSPTSPRPAKRHLPPQLNLQPPNLLSCHTLNVPSPSSPRCVSPGFFRQSPFLNPSQPQSRAPSPIMFGNQPPGNITTPLPIHLGRGNADNMNPVCSGQASPLLSPRLQLTPPRTGGTSPVMRVPSPQELSNLAQSILQNALIKKQLEEQKERFVRRQQERMKTVLQTNGSSAGHQTGSSSDTESPFLSHGNNLPIFNIVQPADDFSKACDPLKCLQDN